MYIHIYKNTLKMFVQNKINFVIWLLYLLLIYCDIIIYKESLFKI